MVNFTKLITRIDRHLPIIDFIALKKGILRKYVGQNFRVTNLRFCVAGIVFLSASTTGYGQCTFAIKRTNTNTHCLYAVEEVVWGNAANVAISGNNITKNVVSSSWNAGAISVNQVGNNGWVTTVVDEVNTERMIGLSSQATVSVTPAFN